MNEHDAAEIYATRRIEEMLDTALKAQDHRLKSRRAEDRRKDDRKKTSEPDSGNHHNHIGDVKTVLLFIILNILISGLTAAAVSAYCN